jgi:lysozyme
MMNKSNVARLAGIIGATAAAMAISFTGSNEGKSNTPYRDSGGVWTVCHGQTGVTMRYYSDGECDAMFGDALANFATSLAASTPGYAAMSDGVKTATLDFAYNVGIGAYNGSTYRKRIIAGDPGACDELLKWRFVSGRDCKVRSNNCYGVWMRRNAEWEMCHGS